MQAEQQHHFKQNLCLFCGKTRHITKECSKATSSTAKACSTTATDKNSNTKSGTESKNPWAVLNTLHQSLGGECQPPVWASTWPRVATSGKQKANTYKPPLRGRVILREIKQRHIAKDETEGITPKNNERRSEENQSNKKIQRTMDRKWLCSWNKRQRKAETKRMGTKARCRHLGREYIKHRSKEHNGRKSWTGSNLCQTWLYPWPKGQIRVQASNPETQQEWVGRGNLVGHVLVTRKPHTTPS